MFNPYKNEHIEKIKDLEQLIDNEKMKIILKYSDFIKKELGLDNNMLYVPVYHYSDDYLDNYQYNKLYIIDEDLTKIIDEICYYDRYGDRKDTNHDLFDKIIEKEINSLEEDIIPQKINNVIY